MKSAILQISSRAGRPRRVEWLWSECCLVAVAMLFTRVAELPAQAPRNVIPRNQKPLLNVFPPAVAEQSRPGEGKFVIFTRERLGADWDFMAGAWECIPSRPEMPVTKRVEFCHSSSNPEPLLDQMVAGDSRGGHPQFVRLDVDADQDGYSVNLYQINYRSWDVRCIWQGPRLWAFGSLDQSIFCSTTDRNLMQTDSQRIREGWYTTTDGLRVLDAASGKLSNEIPFAPRSTDGEFWLVRKPGETEGVWSFSVKQRKYIAHFGEVAIPEHLGYFQSKLSPDGRNRAWILARIPQGWMKDWFFGTVDGQLILQRDGQDEDISVPVKFHASATTWQLVHPSGIQLTFPAEGKVEFRASAVDLKPEDRVWSIDIATGQVSENSAALAEVDEGPPALLHGIPVPDYLRTEAKEFTGFGCTGLAPALLMHLGILKERPQYADCAAGLSPDGRHVLYKAHEGPLAGVLIYGDLVTKQTVRWESPAGLSRAFPLEFTWVETPD